MSRKWAGSHCRMRVEGTFGMGVIEAVFHCEGTVDWLRDKEKMWKTEAAKMGAPSLRYQLGSWSGPEYLLPLALNTRNTVHENFGTRETSRAPKFSSHFPYKVGPTTEPCTIPVFIHAISEVTFI